MRLDFREELKNLYPGPWEWLLPEAQASKGTRVPLRGTLYAQAELKPRYLNLKIYWIKGKALPPELHGRTQTNDCALGWVKSGEQRWAIFGERLRTFR